ncbi:MFS transporter [Brevibacillus massiliensis]|uniref:MFS transporter n=1 Tax=Brevibacillus massiliensis TaxID=1118054 RepID=UPI00030B5D6E|nr:MFS transporter [Brevibacillus massiliensis]
MNQTGAALGEQTIRKVKWRILPFLFLLYIIAYLDRVNLGYAALDMNKALAISSQTFGLVSGIFFIGYFLFEIPSNMILHRIGARIWIARIMITWGIVVILTGWVQNAAHLYILRFLLGLAEAGFFPGVILYITYWFRAKEQARAVALLMTALAASNIIGAPLSTWIMTYIDWAGMAGWRWMFVIEGLPAIIFGVVAFTYMTDRPEQAKWLTAEEKAWLVAELKREHEEKIRRRQYTTREVLTNGPVWHLAFIYFALVIGLYGIGFWMPSIIKSFPANYTNLQVGLLSMIPYVVAGLAMVGWARRSDRTGERKFHAALPPILGGLALIVCGMSSHPILSVALMAVATAGIYSFFGPFWALPALFLSEGAAAIGIALINSIGNLGGFVGPYVVGSLKEATGKTEAGLFFLACCVLAAAVLVLLLRKKTIEAGRQNKTDFKGSSHF